MASVGAIAGGLLSGIGEGMVSQAEVKRQEGLERAREFRRQLEKQDDRDFQLKRDKAQRDNKQPNSVQEYEYAQKNPGFSEFLKKTGSSNSPSSVQEWQFYSGLGPDDQKRFLEMKRNPNMVVKEVGGVPTVVAPSVTGTQTTPLSTLPEEANAAATVAGAKSAAEVAGKAGAEAKVDLNSNLDDIQKMRNNVTGLIQSPGFGTIYGISGKTDIRNYIPGTEAANSEARRNQLESQSFGISIQKMRGLGQLSNAEGQKVTSAYTRAVDKKQSPEAAKEAWKEVLSYLDLAEFRAKQKAGAAPASATPQSEITSVKLGPGTAQSLKKIVSDADYAALPSGTEFIAPDDSHRRKP